MSDLQNSLVDNHGVAQELVNHIQELKQQNLDNLDHNPILSRLDSSLDNTAKYRNQVKRLSCMQALFVDSGEVLSRLPSFVQSYCVLNSQVYRFSNLIHIQPSDPVETAIQKYLSHPALLKTLYRKDSLLHSYEVIQGQLNARRSALS